LWPYIEQGPLALQINLKVDFFVAPATLDDGYSLRGPTGQALAMYNCPSDTDGVDQTIDRYQRRRGNYVVNYGNARFIENPGPEGRAPFSHLEGSSKMPFKTTFQHITDGTSNTLLMSELLKARTGEDKDWRGDIMNDQGAHRFHTLLTPNTSAADVIKDGWFTPTGDPAMPATAGEPQYNAARSRHNGGVNVIMCDASGRFVSDNVSLDAWKAMGSMDGGETIPPE
jgi:prepilin-type processing-associated H-X9-DG protein